MVSLRQSRIVHRNDVPLQLKIVPWVVELPTSKHRFETLGQLHQWFNDNPTHPHLKIRRNGSAIYSGPWPAQSLP